MFIETWKKYNSVIAILLKRASKEEQTLAIDQLDFRIASGGKKIKFSFTNLQLNHGRITGESRLSNVAKDFVQSLTDSEATGALIRGGQFEFGMNGNFLLSIKNISALEEDNSQN